MRNIIWISSIILILLVTVPTTAFGAWYNTDWDNRKKITIESDEVSGSSNLTDLPVLVSVTDSDLKASLQSDCDDVIFTSSDETTVIPHEIEKCDSTNGVYTFWVKVPTVVHDTDTDFYIYYGNAVASNQEDIVNVWDNYEAVYHLNDDFLDSTSYGRDGTNVGSSNATGIVSAGQDFDGTNDEIEIGTWSTSSLSTITMQAWVDYDDFDIHDARIVSKATGTATEDHVLMLGNIGASTDDLRTRMKTGTDDSAGTITLIDTAEPALPIGSFSFLAMNYDGSNIKLFRNGTETATDTKTGDIRENNWPWTIGGQGSDNKWIDGIMDEVRIANVTRSADWLTTEFNNIVAPTVFLTLGTEEDAPTGGDVTRNITDELGLDDSVNVVRDITVSITDELGLDDSVQVVVGLIVNVTDELGLDDSTEVIKSLIISITDELGLDDSVSIVQGSVINITDELGLDDSVQVLSGSIITITDELGLDDSVEVLRDITINITDELGLDDSTVVMAGLIIPVNDELGLDDSVQVIVGFTVNITDELGLDDSVSIMAGLIVPIVDELGLDDSVDVVLSAVYLTDELGLDDSVSVSITEQIFNAIKLYLNSPTSSRLGGVFAQSCDSGFYVSGIDNTGTIICTVLP